MISRANLAAYQKIARMTTSINKFMRQAMITKSMINRSNLISMLRGQGIARNVDMMA